MTIPLVIAHRGASGYRPEHTRAAYELAVLQGADGIEPDLVPTRDGVLVLRHENELSDTTDVSRNRDFADRRTTKVIDGVERTGWFTEDFTWAELQTLRANERMPYHRVHGTTFDGRFPLLRLEDLMAILDEAGRPITMVAELKHPTYFASIGLPVDELFARAVAGWATDDNLIVESFEQTVLGEVRSRGVAGKVVYLLENEGAAADLVARYGSSAPSYTSQLEGFGLATLSGWVDGISVNTAALRPTPEAPRELHGKELVDRAHAEGLAVFCWTLRAENTFLPRTLRRGDRQGDWGNWFDAYRTIYSTGVDGVFADQPDLAIFARGARTAIA